MDTADVVLLSTESSLYLAEQIATHLGIQVSETERWSFGDGECYYRIGLRGRNDLLGKNVMFVGSTHTDADFLEIYRVGCAIAGYGARRAIYVIPFLGYQTMERAVKPGEVVTAKANIRLLSTIPHCDIRNTFLMMDLHVPGLVHYFEGNCLRIELYAENSLTHAIAELPLDNFVFGSADLGRPQWVKTFAKEFGTKMVLIDKGREGEKTEVLDVIGDVKGKVVVIYDDMTRSAGSLVQAAIAYLAQGATEIYAVLSHLALNNEGVVDLLIDSPITKIIATNSHPMSQVPSVADAQKIQIVDVSHIFANEITNIL